ncbi:5-methylthioadenosine/S-adenosylhomocysteine deaminase [Lasiodiplodia hormozganensis]|uniref:5-methylthioadenosine/S-adenosylhomocysteine deaminase n=1 Tax=Lasiodiplodia hormozganensis TaxID=869390 RepID=A0AA40CMG1_9PEZI|nr:5-methylthioadenosine/S-adenosylhomocysteine deaminase [Lasiodiplodia hormozganensis]
MASTILLKGGTLLIHDENDHVVPTKADLLIAGNTISCIAPEISDKGIGEVIDCTDKIVSPGFIDCHQHVWQTQLKGRHADETFLEYMPTGNLQSSHYTLSDFYWGQLGGCLELLNAGTTTVLDHAHLNTSPEASPTAISATLTSGIRSIFAYTPINQVASWEPTLAFSTSPDGSMLAPWVLETFNSLASRSPFGPGDGRVTLGLAFDGWFLPEEACRPLFAAARQHNIHLLTTHFVRNASQADHSLPAHLQSWGLLPKNEATTTASSSSSSPHAFPSVVFSHSNGATADDIRLMKASGSHLASTPSTELQMALGRPLAFSSSSSEADAFAIACAGNDCHAAGAGSIAGELRLGLQAARGERNQRFLDAGRVPRRAWRSVEDAFNLGTVHGARALALDGVAGRLREGCKADVVVWAGTSPAMVCAAQEDPVAAIVLHSSPQDVEAVVVDGVVRKRGGRLVDVMVEEDARGIVGKERVTWSDVAKELVKSRAALKKKCEGTDFEAAKKVLMDAWYIDGSKIVDEV